MDKWIVRNWLILSITALIVGFWIGFFEDFTKGKAYMFFILSIVFFYLWLKKSGKI